MWERSHLSSIITVKARAGGENKSHLGRQLARFWHRARPLTSSLKLYAAVCDSVSRLKALPWQRRLLQCSPWWVCSVWVLSPWTGRVRTRSSSRTIRVRTSSSSWRTIRASTTSATTTETSTHRHWTNWLRKEWSWRTTTSSPSVHHHGVSSSLAGNSLTLLFAPCLWSILVTLVYSKALWYWHHMFRKGDVVILKQCTGSFKSAVLKQEWVSVNFLRGLQDDGLNDFKK